MATALYHIGGFCFLRFREFSGLEKFCEATQADFTERFSSSFASIQFRRIAARPVGGIQPTNEEIQSLFAHWLKAPIHAPAPSATRNRQPVRDFCAFGLT